MLKLKNRFLIIDDDPQNNLLTTTALKKVLGDVEINTFEDAETGLDFIELEFINNSDDLKTTLFLDVNMPHMNGWDFLEKYETLEKSLTNQFNIYMLSSSIDPCDIERAKHHPMVIDFIEKPLTKALLLKMFG